MGGGGGGFVGEGVGWRIKSFSFWGLRVDCWDGQSFQPPFLVLEYLLGGGAGLFLVGFRPFCYLAAEKGKVM